MQEIIRSYYSWAKCVSWTEEDPRVQSSKLFDTLAVYLTLSEEYVKIENLGIKVTDDGYTLIDDQEKVIRCATKWNKLTFFEDWLVNRLTSNLVPI